jgi:hypothetical protein
MPPAGFELAIPATKLPQTYALHRAATGIGSYDNYIGVQHLLILTTFVTNKAPNIKWNLNFHGDI